MHFKINEITQKYLKETHLNSLSEITIVNNDGYLVSEAKPTASTARISDYRQEQLAI